MLRETEEAVPARNQDHVVGQVFALDFQLLHDDDVGLEDVEHGGERAVGAPWMVSKRVADAVDIPRRDAHHGGGGITARRVDATETAGTGASVLPVSIVMYLPLYLLLG